MCSNRFGAIPCHIMTLSLPLNDECYESFFIEDLIFVDIDNGSLQEELEHWSHSLLVPKYAPWDYILANRLNSRACCEQSWNRGWRQPRTQVLIRFKERTMKDLDVSEVVQVDRDEK